MRRFANAHADAIGLLAALFLLAAGPAVAKPTEAQLDAIKSNCRSDFMSNCWGVKRGGVEAFQCLKEHMASLSPGCQKAVKAATPAPAPAPSPAKTEPSPPEPAVSPPKPAAQPPKPAAPAPQAAPATPREAGAKPEAPAPAASSATPPASAPKAAAPAEEEAVPPVKAATPPPKAAAPAAETEAPAAQEAAPPIIGFIPPRKKLMVRRNCRQDLETYCAGVDFGDGRLLRCLLDNRQSLTPDCQGALARLTQ